MLSGVALVSGTGTVADSLVMDAVAVAMSGFSLLLNFDAELVSNPALTLLLLRVLKQERFGPISIIGCASGLVGRKVDVVWSHFERAVQRDAGHSQICSRGSKWSYSG
jgi:hypothetical protein